jgi:urease subunit beta
MSDSPHPDEETPIVPGEVVLADGPVIVPGGAPIQIKVANLGDRAVQVGSHYHFAEANSALSFDRHAARGMRLGVPAGTAVRFEPNIERVVELVPLAGRRIVRGLRGLVSGRLDQLEHP